MTILIVVDKKGSAIDRLAETVKKFNPHLQIHIQPLHPKRPSADQLADAVSYWDSADLVHVSYWRSGEKFKELYPERWRKKQKLLWHHNPYDIEKKNWTRDYEKVVVHNSTIHSKIPYAKLVPQCIDLDYYKFNRDYTKEKVVNMVVGRIEGKKGVVEVARACKKLGYKFLLVGKISKKAYFDQIMEVNPDTDFRENIPDDDLIKAYYESAVHVCNSVDDFESGTMPILEAMATGVPVLTRNIGHVPDLYDGGNMVIRAGAQGDQEDLEKELKDLVENFDLRVQMRERGWRTVKNRPAEKMARLFSNVYYKMYGDSDPLVSVIIPTRDKPDVLAECLFKWSEEGYKNKELIVVDSGDKSVDTIIKTFREKTNIPIKYFRIKDNKHYTLPQARNIGVIEAQGSYMLFCDERIGVEPKAIEAFLDRYTVHCWLYGVKDDAEKGFVENFSFVKRQELLKYGLFNERINFYGGASEDIRRRYGQHGILFELVSTARAKSLAKSGSKHNRKPQIIKAKLVIWKMYG